MGAKIVTHFQMQSLNMGLPSSHGVDSVSAKDVSSFKTSESCDAVKVETEGDLKSSIGEGYATNALQRQIWQGVCDDETEALDEGKCRVENKFEDEDKKVNEKFAGLGNEFVNEIFNEKTDGTGERKQVQVIVKKVSDTSFDQIGAADDNIEKLGDQNHFDKESQNSEIMIVPKKISINYNNIMKFCLILSLSGFPLGWDVATSSSVLSNINFPIKITSSWEFGLIISCFHIGCCCGSLVLGNQVANLKILLQLAILIYAFGSILQVLAVFFMNKWGLWPFILGRLIIGIGCGTLGVVSPVYTQELVVGGNKTSFYLSFHQILVAATIFLGNLISYCLNSWKNYIYFIEIVKIGYISFYFCLIWWLPNSIKYFKITKQYNQLWLIYNQLIINLNETVFQQILNTPIQNIEKFSKETIRPMIIGCLIMFFQQFTGINYFFYYGTIIFPTPISIVILCFINLLASFFSSWLIQKVKLKLILTISSYLMSIVLIIYSNLGQFTNSPSILIILTTLFIILFAISWGPGAGIMVNLTSHGNSLIMSGAIASNWLSNCIITLITPWMIAQTGFLYGCFFATMLIILGTFVHYFVE
jgi:SP family sugar:H+ symporter-like MFS transporter